MRKRDAHLELDPGTARAGELAKEIKKLKQELHMRGELARVVSAYTKPGELMTKVLEVLCNGFGAGGGAVFFMEKDSDEISLRATFNLDDTYAIKYQRIHLGSHVTGMVAKSGEGAIIKDSWEDARATKGVVEMLKYRSAAVTPVTSEGEVVGIIALVHETPGFFTEEDLRKLEYIAAYISLAIINSFLNQEISQERERTLDILEKVEEGIFEAVVKIPLDSKTGPDDLTIGFYQNAFFTMMNPSFVRQCGIDLKIGDPIRKGFEDIQLFRMLREVLEKGFVMGVERRWIGEEERLFEVSMVRMDREGRVKGINGLRREVTSRVRMEEKLQESRSQTELYMDLMSHDIANINTTVIGFLDLLSEKLKDNKELSRYVVISKEEIERSSQLVGKVKNLSRIQKERPELTFADLTVRIVRNLDKVKREYPKKLIKMDMETEEEGPIIVKCDEMVDEMFQGVLKNAIAQTPGDEVEIEIDMKKWTFDNKNGFLVSISDHGKGLTDDLKERVFDRRFRQDGKQSGSGLGMSVVRGIAERYGGRVWVEDRVHGRPNEGSKFMIFMPSATS